MITHNCIVLDQHEYQFTLRLHPLSRRCQNTILHRICTIRTDLLDVRDFCLFVLVVSLIQTSVANDLTTFGVLVQF
jgi:hypothetical protein